MKLTINNIGKLKNAEVEINGITVITGENDTGKSTVGKVLWSVFNSFYEIKNQVRKDKINSIFRESRRFLGLQQSRKLRNKIVQESEIDEEIDLDDLINQIEINLRVERNNNKEIERILDKIKKRTKLPEKEVLKEIIQKNFDNEFNYQINNIYTDDIGKISLTIKEKNIDLSIMNDNIFLDNDLSFNITEDIVYIDDPFILDDMYSMNRTYGFRRPSLNHKGHLLRQLCQQQENNIIEEVIKQKSIQNIIKQLNNICPGALLLQPDSIKYVNNGKGINVKNLSSGLKTFAILKELIIKNIINTQGVIILDEPEIHLHPEWQLVLAELIILLQVEFNLHILLTTHSPYFLNAIEVYAKKYQIIDRCKYYLSEYDANATGVLFSDVSKNIDKIYEKLAKPLQKLENLRY